MFDKTNHKYELYINFKTTDKRKSMTVMVSGKFFRYNQVRRIRKTLIYRLAD